ncbi:chloride channel protein [Streptomyces mesophilus]|uniref:chloride channel protein n=1 Tax=Streptomyces mesophilus TaxID=1775132 RepID=UPI0019D1E40B|nr:chloride channel protein [Streptomyces mesophilus]
MTVLVGLAAGVAGALLALLLHGVQHVAYGYHEGSFLAGVEAAPPGRRVAVMAVAGVVAGVGWWALYRYGRPLVSIAEAVRSPDVRMPPLTTFCHALLQIVTVGLGSPLGREVAPREMASVLAGELTRRTGLSPRQCGVLTACAAGAGLAAVYDVPLGGAVFTLEVLLGSWALGAVLPAVATAVTATVVSWAVLPDEAVYRLPQLDIGAPLLVWSVLVGPVVGVCAYWFARLAADARERAPRGRLLLVAAPAAFLVGGLLAVPYPQLLGNGKAPAEVAFEAQPALGLAAVLLALRVALVLLCLRAGARGGLLTPSLANGALLGVVAGGAWALLWPGDSPAAYAVVGAGAFLAAAQRMPLTAVILILEFTDAPRNLVVPVLLAVTGAMATRRLCERRRAGDS